MAAKKIKYIFDDLRKGKYVRSFREGRSNIIVQIWIGKEPIDEPDFEWVMPSVLGLETCICQALLQSKG